GENTVSGFMVKPNCGRRIPRWHVVVDTETVPCPIGETAGKCEHRLMLGVARLFKYEGGRATRQWELEFRDAAVFWAWLTDELARFRPLTVWCHNAGFDLTVLGVWRLLEAGELALVWHQPGPIGDDGQPGPDRLWRGTLVDNDPPTILIARHRSGQIVRFLDTLNFFPCSLRRIGEMVGTEKLPMPGEQASDEDWLAYCRRDVDITQEAVVRLLT